MQAILSSAGFYCVYFKINISRGLLWRQGFCVLVDDSDDNVSGG